MALSAAGFPRTTHGAGVTHVFGDNGAVRRGRHDHRRRRRCRHGGRERDREQRRANRHARRQRRHRFSWRKVFRPRSRWNAGALSRRVDPGSDDLTFTWSVGDVNTYFNNGVSADLFPSPFGTFPFAASDSIEAMFEDAAFVALQLTLADDDGGANNVEGGAIVTGTAIPLKAMAGGNISTPAPDRHNSTTTRCSRTWPSSTRCPACSPRPPARRRSRRRTRS